MCPISPFLYNSSLQLIDVDLLFYSSFSLFHCKIITTHIIGTQKRSPNNARKATKQTSKIKPLYILQYPHFISLGHFISRCKKKNACRTKQLEARSQAPSPHNNSIFFLPFGDEAACVGILAVTLNGHREKGWSVIQGYYFGF